VAKTRAQRKAERRAREQRAAKEAERSRDADSRAQARTQMPETADVVEAELAEEGADLDQLAKESPDGAATEEAPKKEKRQRRLRSPAPSRADVGQPEDAAVAETPAEDKISRRARRHEEKERERRRRESAKRREAPSQPTEARQRGRVIGFFISCWAELKRVQWPDRETLIQASMVTVIFIAVAAAYLGALDAFFNWLVQRLI
jgi:preprotein translocase SecE subunit